MFDFFSSFFKRDTSSATAKERLRLVLLSDHLSLAPDTVAALKRELIEVISRYVKVDVSLCDVSFEQQAATVAMHANIPILGLQTDRPPVAPPTFAQSEPTKVAETADPGYLHDLHDDVREKKPLPKSDEDAHPDEIMRVDEQREATTGQADIAKRIDNVLSKSKSSAGKR